jgi:protein subunit release factor B
VRTEKEKLFSVSIHDCRVETKRGTGKGGQNRNTRDTAVRIVHEPSGAVGESQEERSQYQNKKAAWKRMIATGKFRMWLSREAMTREGMPSPEEEAEKQMAPQNLRVEIKDDRGRWTPEQPE